MPDPRAQTAELHLGHGISALRCLSSLLLQAAGHQHSQLDLVNPEHLCCLLDIIADRLQMAEDGYAADRSMARAERLRPVGV